MKMNGSVGNFKESPGILRTTISCDLNVRLTALVSRTHYNLIQCNGQRIYGPPPNWKGPRPPRGCEIFVGHLPHDAYEDELIPIFSRPGKIYELRLMMEFSGYTRGFCFVVYANKEGAKRAVNTLHLLQIRSNVKITVYRSLDNSRLFVCGIPFEKTREEIWGALENVLGGITDVIVHPNPHDKNKNRGYVFIDFLSHRHAMEARKTMWPSRLVIWGAQLHAEWAVPIPVESNLRKLYITNLSPMTSREVLAQFILDKTKNSKCIVHVTRQRKYAIVQFTSRLNAQTALDALRGSNIHGHLISVDWVRNQRKKLPLRAPRITDNPARRPEEMTPMKEDEKQARSSPSMEDVEQTEFFNTQLPSNFLNAQAEVYSGEPLYYNNPQPPLPSLPHNYRASSNGLSKPLPPHMFPPMYFPRGVAPYNSFIPPAAFQQPFFAPTTRLPLPFPMNPPPSSEVFRARCDVSFNNYLPSPGIVGEAPAHLWRVPSEPYPAGTNFILGTQTPENRFFVPVSWCDGVAGDGLFFNSSEE